MFPADFGHLCERLRRAQGRGPSLEKDRGSAVIWLFVLQLPIQILGGREVGRFCMLLSGCHVP